jgi:hypothetical protein
MRLAPQQFGQFMLADCQPIAAPYAQNPFRGPRMRSGKPCIDCRTLIDSSVANKPHVLLKRYYEKALVQGDAEYYECQFCGTRLLREQKEHDPKMHWRVI